MSRNTSPHVPFEGFDSPNYTQVPDELFDQLMPDLSDAELRVLLYIVRRTFGFKKDSDDISLSQMVDGITTGDGRVLDRGTGLSKATVARGLTRLKEKGIIVAVRNCSPERGNQATTYRLRFKGDRGIPLVSPVRQAPLSQQQDIPLSQQQDKQETDQQQTDRDLSKFEGSHDDFVETTNGLSQFTPLQTPAGNDSLLPLGEILRQKAAKHEKASDERKTISGEKPWPRGRVDERSEERERLRAFLADFAVELGDEAPLASTITRTLNIFHAAGVPPERWSDHLYQARGLTQEHTAQIRKTATNSGSNIRQKNKMPYFLATLEQLVGLRPAPTTASPGHARSS